MSYFKILIIISFFCSSWLEAHNSNKGITYNIYGGRFGDNLLAYMHAKWFSLQYDIPLLYRPFHYSKDLALERYDKRLENWVEKKFLHHLTLKKGEDIDNLIKRDLFQSTLYMIPYFPECLSELEKENEYPYFTVDWEDPYFLEVMKKMIAPKKRIKTVNLPQDRLSIALHIRTGDGFDSEEVKAFFPLKFPPLSFFIWQLVDLCHFFEEQPLYVHIFSDAFDIKAITSEIKSRVNHRNIEFGCREDGNDWQHNVLEDFFSLTKFDISIHGSSNFAFCAAILAHHQLEIIPKIPRASDFLMDRISIKGKNAALITRYKDYIKKKS